MNEMRPLLTLELRSLYGINKLRHTKDRREKKRYRGLLAVAVILIALAAMYTGAMVYGLCALGLGEIAPAYLVTVASLLILVFGIFTAGFRIFGRQGYDLLMSMPVRPWALAVSRLLSLYIGDLSLALLIMVPGTVVYGICMQPHWAAYLTALVGTVFIPVFPLVISVLIGTAIMALSSRMRRKNLIQSLLSVGLVLGMILISTRLNGADITVEALLDLVNTVSGLLGRLYPPAIWLNRAVSDLDLGGLALFAGAALTAAALATALMTVRFRKTLERLGNVSAGRRYQIGQMGSRGLLKALWIREAKRYFSSSIYVTNTILGPILGAAASVALCAIGPEKLFGEIPLDLTALLPFGIGGIFCMMTTTSTAISMEGKQFWLIKSLPIPVKTWLDSKILLNLTLILPFCLISAVAMLIAFWPDFWLGLWAVLIPGVMILFSVIFGIAVNLKFHSFDWEKEETVVKQSLSAALGGLGGFLLCLVLGAGMLAVPGEFENMAKGAVCLAALGVAVWLYRRNNRAVIEKL